jgi:tRNA(fMet)-specific endonuclease VapC
MLKWDSRRARFEAYLKDRAPGVSVTTVAELRRWSLERRWGKRQLETMERALSRYAIIGPTADTAAHWARIYVERKRLGRPISVSDCWNAATAIQYKLPLVTNNVKDFGDIPGLVVVGPA